MLKVDRPHRTNVSVGTRAVGLFIKWEHRAFGGQASNSNVWREWRKAMGSGKV